MREDGAAPATPRARIPREMIKDRSSLCANYCREYRRTADMAQPMDTSTRHDGLRLIALGKAEVANVLLPRLIQESMTNERT